MLPESRFQILELETLRDGLAAGGESAYVCDREAQVFVGIYRSVIDADFVMEVRAGAAAALTDESDGVAAMHVLAGHDGKVRQVAVACRDAMAVVDHDGASVSAHEVGKGDDSVGGRHNGLPVSGSDIDAAVECAFSVERVNALAKRSSYRAFDRPKIRG